MMKEGEMYCQADHLEYVCVCVCEIDRMTQFTIGMSSNDECKFIQSNRLIEQKLDLSIYLFIDFKRFYYSQTKNLTFPRRAMIWLSQESISMN